MIDAGRTETDELLEDLERRLKKEYAQATSEVIEKLSEYTAQFEKDDKRMKKRLEDDKITEKEYELWRIEAMAEGERWEAMKDTLAEDYQNVNKIAKSMIAEHCQDVYALNYNFGTYSFEHATTINTSFTLYDRHTVAMIMKKDPNLLPPPGKKVSKAIAEGKAIRWNKQQVQSVMIQAIYQGESIDKIARRLGEAVGESNMNASIRNARTMTTGAESAGRVDSFERAQEMTGIEVKNQWLAVMDGRTRHEHRLLDGEKVAQGEKFKVDGYEIAFPGDPQAEPHLVYNCRCAVVAAIDIEGLENNEWFKNRRNEALGDMTYEEWKHELEGKKKVKQEQNNEDASTARKPRRQS